MRLLLGLAFAILIACVGSSYAYAEEGVLVIHVADTKGVPVAGVILSATGDSSVSAPTDRAGKTRIKLAPQTRPGSELTLQIVKAAQDLVFISPWNNRVIVPPFRNDTGVVVEVVLVERGSRLLLEDPKAALAMAASVNAANTPKAADVKLTEENRRANLMEVAKIYGLKPAEVDTAIRAWGEKATDPYEIGLAALYARNYPEATRQLSLSVETREKKLEKDKEDLADATFFLGQSLYEEERYREALNAFQKAAKLRPDDTKVLSYLAQTLGHTGEYVKAEALLRQLLATYEKTKSEEGVVEVLVFLAWQYKEQGRFSESEAIFKQVLEMKERLKGKEHEETAYVLINMGTMYMSQEEYTAAEAMYKRVLNILRRTTSDNTSTLVGTLVSLATVCIKQEKYNEAKQYLDAAAAEIEKAKEPEKILIITVKAITAQLYMSQHKYAEAERLAKEAVELSEKTYGNASVKSTLALMFLAVIYSDQCKYAEAESLYKQSIKITEDAMGTDHPSLHGLLVTWSEVLEQQNRDEDAVSVTKRALAIIEKERAVKTETYLYTVTLLASLYAKLGKYDEEEALWKNVSSEEIKKVSERAELSISGTKLLSRAMRYDAEGKYAEAEQLYKKLVEDKQARLKPDDSQLATAFFNLATFYYSRERYAEAELFLNKARPILEAELGQESCFWDKFRPLLAYSYFYQKKFDDAEPLLKRILAGWEKTKKNDLKTARALEVMGSIYFARDDYENAEPYLKKALTAYEENLGKSDLELLDTLIRLCNIYGNQGLHATAEECFDRALGIMEAKAKPDDLRIADFLTEWAENSLAREDYGKAEMLLKKAVVVVNAAVGPNNLREATLLEYLAEAYAKQEKYAEAEPVIRKVLSIRQEKLNAEHPDLAGTLEKYADVLRHLYRFSEAVKLEERAKAIRAKYERENRKN
ncbi:MAG TPA: tetratricopeptide repeat protein [Pyrinomonadaceae bacterium]|nr:tetratricopeptide repeat protein [Pyrinomonadaceae bacterium]